MEEKQTLYSYLHRTLREQIITGYLPHGAALPSIQRLSEMYHVGIRTVRDALDALRREGLICTQERRVATVSYRWPAGDGGESFDRSALENKSSILAVYKTMAALIPGLLAVSARSCSRVELSERCKPLVRAGKGGPEEKWRTVSALLCHLLDASQNPLFRDVYTHLEMYSRTPYFLEQKRFRTLIADYNDYQDTLWAISALQEGEPEKIIHRFSAVFHSTADAVRVYLDEVSSRYPAAVENRDGVFSWNAERGRGHYYMQITRDLIDKIAAGVYREGAFLPSEAALAQHYKVSVSTIRNALTSLCRLGFGQTFNGRGTQIIRQDNQAIFQCMKNKAYKKDTLLCLSGLQFMIVAIGPAARLAFPRIGPDKQVQLLDKIKAAGEIPLEQIQRGIIDALPLQPLRLILQEVSRSFLWSYYFSFFSRNGQSSKQLNRESLDAFRRLQTGDQEGFSRRLCLCYDHIFRLMRDFMAVCGLPEAARLISPIQ